MEPKTWPFSCVPQVMVVVLVWGPHFEDHCHMLSLKMAWMTHMTLSLGSNSVERKVVPHFSDTHIKVTLHDRNHHLVWAACTLV